MNSTPLLTLPGNALLMAQGTPRYGRSMAGFLHDALGTTGPTHAGQAQHDGGTHDESQGGGTPQQQGD